MHLLLALSSIVLVMLGSSLTLGILHRVGSWSQRRDVQCFVLAVPIVSLLLGIGGLHHFSGRACLSQAPSWDSLLGVALPVTMGAVAFGALSLGITRLVLMAWMVARSSTLADPELQSLADGLARRLGSPRCRVLLRVYDRPLAFTSGIVRPRVLLSTWMVEHLDRRELEAVVGTTHRPLALASALAKVLLHAVEEPQLARLGVAQPLVRVEEPVNSRIERLLATPQPASSAYCASKGGLRISLPALVGLLILEGVNLSLMLALMGCGPALLLGKLF